MSLRTELSLFFFVLTFPLVRLRCRPSQKNRRPRAEHKPVLLSYSTGGGFPPGRRWERTEEVFCEKCSYSHVYFKLLLWCDKEISAMGCWDPGGGRVCTTSTTSSSHPASRMEWTIVATRMVKYQPELNANGFWFGLRPTAVLWTALVASHCVVPALLLPAALCSSAHVKPWTYRL